MNSTWADRDFPVLESIVRRTDESGHEVGLDEIEQDTGLSPEDVQRAIKALDSDGGYIRVSTPNGGGHIDFVLSATSKARREVGAWPTPENITSELVDRLEQLANDENAGEDTRTRARRMLDAVADGGGAVLTGVLTSILTTQMGL